MRLRGSPSLIFLEPPAMPSVEPRVPTGLSGRAGISTLQKAAGNGQELFVGCCGFIGPVPSTALDKRTVAFWPRPGADK